MDKKITSQTQIASLKKRNKIQKFRIDKNLILRLHQIEKRSKIIFDGTILYLNGLELTLSPNYWKLISDYHKVQTDNIIYLYNFDSYTVDFRSYREFIPGCRLQDDEIEIITMLIKKDVMCFVDKLYQYGILDLKGKYFFKRNFQETIFNKKIIDQFNLLPSNKEIILPIQTQTQSLMIDQNQQQLTGPNIHFHSISPVKGKIRCNDLPLDMQYGPKNVKYHFNDGDQLSKTKGGFFTLKKLFCSLKKLQNFQNQNFFYQNSTHNPPQGQPQVSKQDVRKQILVKKSLKPERQQSKINRMKILKELVIVQQIKKSKHLINYYVDDNVKGLKTFFNLTNQKELEPEIKNLSQNLSTLNVKEQQNSSQNQRSIEFQNVFMDFHPHTLQDYLSSEHNHIDSKIKMCLQTIESIMDIHRNKVIHRDFKPQNALIDYNTDKFNPTLKLIDFSESAIFISQTKRFQNPQISKNIIRQIFDKHSSRFYAATMPYSPPQCQLNRQNRTSKGVNSFNIDYWSMGMILFEIFVGKKLLNYSRPYEDDILNVIKEVGFENYYLKAKRRGFRIIQNAIQLIAIKNVVCDQSKRMDPHTCHNILNQINQKYSQWTTRFNQREQHKKAPLIKC